MCSASNSCGRWQSCSATRPMRRRQRTAQPQPTSLRGIQEREERLWMESDVAGESVELGTRCQCVSSLDYISRRMERGRRRNSQSAAGVEGVVTMIETGGDADLSGRTATPDLPSCDQFSLCLYFRFIVCLAHLRANLLHLQV